MTQSKKLIYGSLWPDAHFGHKIANQFAERVTRETGGQIQASVTPPSSDSQLTKDLLDGKIQMTSGHDIQEFVPQLALSYLPYFYRDFNHFRSIWTLGKSPVSDSMVKIIENTVNVKVLGYSLIGFRDVILRNDFAINEPKDFHGLCIRNDGSSTTHDVFTAFGADPKSIEYHKVKNALAIREVNAAANTTFNLIYMGWYEVCKHISLTEHQMLFNCELVNNNFWNSLTKQEQNIINVAMNYAVKDFADTAASQRDLAIDRLKNEFGLIINKVNPLTKEELAIEVFPMKKEFVKKYNMEEEYNYILNH